MKTKEKIQLNTVLTQILEIVLCCYIVFVPIINAFKYWIFGYGIHVYLALLIIMIALALRIMNANQKRSNFHGLPILLFFLVQRFYWKLSGYMAETPFLLLYGLYASFLSLPANISRKKIFISYYISVYIAMVFTLVNGLNGGSVTRTGATVDGSIAIIGVILLLFLEEDFETGTFYRVLKIGSMIPVAVVLLFGMSRARILIALLLVGIKMTVVFLKSLRASRIKGIHMLLFIGFVIIGVASLKLPVVQSLLDEVVERFESGLISEGRDSEAGFALMAIKNYPIMGIGYHMQLFYDHNTIPSVYYNHNMYLAIVARGGFSMALLFLISFASLIKRVWNSKDRFLTVLTFCFFLLGYGNAGIFNYTIIGYLIPIVLGLRQYETPAKGKVRYERSFSLKRRS